MKKKLTIIAAGILTCAVLTGCAKQAFQMQETVPEHTSVNRQEQTLPEPTEAFTEVPTEVPTEAPTEAPAPFQMTVTPVITQPQTQVRVTTADEFLAAIAPNTEIILDAPLIDLSEAKNYGKTGSQYYFWYDEFDGPVLYISNVTNLTIRGGGEDHNANVISALPRYAYVLIFENCGNIHVTGFTAGHAKEPGYCMGGVLGFRNSQDILVEDCGLFGCGTWGVMGENSRNMQIVSNDIYECSYGGVTLYNCENVNMDENTLRDLGTPEFPGTEFRVDNSKNVTCNGIPVER